MKQYTKSTLAILIAGILIAVTQPGCKEHTVINSGFAPGIGNVNLLTTTFPVISKTQYYDSVITSNAEQYVYMGAGMVNDPLIGTTNAGIYLQVIPGIKNTGYDNYTIDSAVIILPYTGFTYGDNSTPVKSFNVYGITDPTFTLNNSSTGAPNFYFAFNNIAHNTFYFTSVPIPIYNNLLDSVSVPFEGPGVNVRPHMRIPIYVTDLHNPAYPYSPDGYKLLLALMHADSVTTDYPSYTTQFPGIYIEQADTATSQTGIPYVQLDGDGLSNYDGANILMYTHTPAGAITALTTYTELTFYFSAQYCAHYNKITHKYKGQGLSYFVAPPHLGTAPSTNAMLLENGPGGVIDVKVGGISALLKPDPTKPPIINQAQLRLTVTPPPSQTLPPGAPYPPPMVTYPYSVTTVNGYDVLSEVADRYPITSTSPLSFIDGTKDSVYNSKTNTYTYYYLINVPRELQLALANKLDTLHLRINGSTDYWGAYRAIIGSGNDVDTAARMKFNVVYSRLK